jgi:hypothetical protein
MEVEGRKIATDYTMTGWRLGEESERGDIHTPTAEVTNLAAPVTPSSLEEVLIGIFLDT